MDAHRLYTDRDRRRHEYAYARRSYAATAAYNAYAAACAAGATQHDANRTYVDAYDRAYREYDARHANAEADAVHPRHDPG